MTRARPVVEALLVFCLALALAVLLQALAVGALTGFNNTFADQLGEGTATWLRALRTAVRDIDGDLFVQSRRTFALVATALWLARDHRGRGWWRAAWSQVIPERDGPSPSPWSPTAWLAVLTGVALCQVLSSAVALRLVGFDHNAVLEGLAWDAVVQDPGLWAAAAMMLTPVLAELQFRGLAWNVLERAGGPVVAWLGSATLFAALHQPYGVRALALAHLALLLGALRLRYRSLWPGLIANVLFQATLYAMMVYPLLTPRPSLAVSTAMQVLYLALIAWLYVGWKRQRDQGVPELARPLPTS